jgi:uncharacterized protein
MRPPPPPLLLLLLLLLLALLLVGGASGHGIAGAQRVTKEALVSWLHPVPTRNHPKQQRQKLRGPPPAAALRMAAPHHHHTLAFTATAGASSASSSGSSALPFRPPPAATGATLFPTTAETTLLAPFAGGAPPPAEPVWWNPFGGDGQGPDPTPDVEPPAPPPEGEEEADRAGEGEGPALAPRVYCFTKFPTPGRTKTRMIPALGSQGATILHRRLVRQTLETLDAFRRATGVDCRVRYDGADDVGLMMGWLGLDWVYESQGPGDLGQRMARATALADGGEEGVGPVVLIGSDCPFVTPAHLGAAVAALGGVMPEGDGSGGSGGSKLPYDLVLGPAADGGYWLVGLRQPCPELFDGVEWGTEKVLAQTLAIAERLGLRVKLLETLADLDRPSDLALWTPPPLTSVVIPVLNEAENLPATLESIYNGTLVPSRPSSSAAAASVGSGSSKGAFGRRGQRGSKDLRGQPPPQQQATQPPAGVEVIVVDGGSSDESKAVALALGARVLSAPEAHRAKQLNLGAAAASGDVLLFLHADTHLPPHWEAEVRAALKDPRTLATAFGLKIAAKGAFFRFLEAAVALRSSWPLRLPYGDQALAMRREAFERLGGYREDCPVMEDYALIRALHRRLRADSRQGRPVVVGGSGPVVQLLPSAVTTSARRWERLGPVRTTVVNQLMVLGWHLRVPPEKLAAFYRQQREEAEVRRAKEAEQGREKREKKKGEGPGGGKRQRQQQQQQPPLKKRGGGGEGEEELARAFLSLAPLVIEEAMGS